MLPLYTLHIPQMLPCIPIPPPHPYIVICYYRLSINIYQYYPPLPQFFNAKRKWKRYMGKMVDKREVVSFGFLEVMWHGTRFHPIKCKRRRGLLFWHHSSHHFILIPPKTILEGFPSKSQPYLLRQTRAGNKEGVLKAPSKDPVLLNGPSDGLNTHNKQAHAIQIKNHRGTTLFWWNKETNIQTSRQAKSHTKQSKQP